MVKHRIREWLLAHPGLLWLLFLLMSKTTEHAPEVTTQAGSSAYKGP
jgi:hypothetical protein